MISTFPVETTATARTKRRRQGLRGGGREERRESTKEREVANGAQGICACAPDAASFSSPPPHPPPALFLSSPMAKREAAGSAVRGRRGALCVSENVALIGGSVAVMRYQPPANKRINVKR